MLRVADNGDMLFFSSKLLVASVQRLVTASDYDHIAMFLRFADGQLIYLESSSNFGVQIFKWDDFLNNKLFLNYEKIAFRKVRCARSQLNIAKL